MTDDEKTKEAREIAEEASRVSVALRIAIVAAVLSAAIVFAFLYCGRSRTIAILQPLLALSLSTALTAAARALDGPIRLGGRRREALSSSAAAASVLLWLGCFGAIEATFLVVDVVDRWNSGGPSCPAHAIERFEGVLTVSEEGAERTLALTGCRVRNPAGGKVETTSPQNAQDTIGVDADNGAQEQ